MARAPSVSSPLTVAAALNLEHAHGQGILRGIARAANEQANVLLLRFSHTRLGERAWLESLDADGLIVKVTTEEDAARLERLNLPVIDVGAECAQHKLARVTTDNVAVGELAAGYFLRRGFRQLGYVGIRGHGASELRRDGFLRAVAKAGLPGAWFEDAFDDANRRARLAVGRRLRRWLETLPIPAGIFCADDPIATSLAELCVATGRRVPADASVLGCNNDLTEIRSASIETSSIDLNTERIGYEAMQLMHSWLREGRRPPAATTFRPLKIVTRRSTDGFAVTDESVLLALEFIHERTAGTFSVEDVARAAGVSRRLLEMRFRKQLDCSIYGEVQRLRFERAVALLANRDLRLVDVAREAGFSSPPKLSAAFQANYHVSPSRFRKRHHGSPK